MDLLLTDDQKHWLLLAHPDTWELPPSPNDDVAMGCVYQGLVVTVDMAATHWRLTPKGGDLVRRLREVR